MSKPSYTINRFDRVVAIRLIGTWNQTIDIDYLSELATLVQGLRQHTWAMIVDMRQWHCDPVSAANTTNYDFHLDRRNQIAECWLVNDASQASHLDLFFQHLPFTLVKALDLQQLSEWASENNIQLSDKLLSWLNSTSD